MYVCASTFAFDATGSFKKCSGCGITFYSSKEAQKDNWKYHKLTCRKPFDYTKIQGSIYDVWGRLQKQIGRRAFDADTCSLMKRLCQLYDSASDDEMDIEMHSHSYAQSFLSLPNNHYTSKLHKQLFAAPGIAQYFLVEDVILPPILVERIKKYPEGYPTRAGLEYLKTAEPEQYADIQSYLDKEDEAGRGPASHCYLYFTLLVSFAVHSMPNRFSSQDGHGEFRETEIAQACGPRILSLWMNPEIREYCDIAIAPAYSFAFIYIEKMFLWRNYGEEPGELLHRIPVDGVLLACYDQLYEPGHDDFLDYSKQIIGLVSRNCYSITTMQALLSLPVQRKIKLILHLTQLLLWMEEPFDTVSLEFVQKIFWFVVVTTDHCDDAGQLLGSFNDPPNRKEFLEQHSVFWATLAESKDSFPAGKYDEVRAFFQYLLRLPAENGMQLIQTKPWYFSRGESVYDFLGMINKWKGIPWPKAERAASGMVSEQVLEKFTCMKLVQYPLLFTKDTEKVYG